MAAEIQIYGDIGDGGVSAASVAEQLRALPAGTKDVEVRINSQGGCPFSSLAIYNQLRRHPARITVTVDGLAASGGSIIMMAGDRRLVARNAFVMLHECAAGAAGYADDLSAMAELVEQINAEMASLYADRTGLEVARVREIMRAETWMNGDRAVAEGVAHEVVDQVALVASVPPGRFRNLPDALRPTPSNTAAERAADIADACFDAGLIADAPELIRSGLDRNEALEEIERRAAIHAAVADARKRNPTIGRGLAHDAIRQHRSVDQLRAQLRKIGSSADPVPPHAGTGSDHGWGAIVARLPRPKDPEEQRPKDPEEQPKQSLADGWGAAIARLPGASKE